MGKALLITFLVAATMLASQMVLADVQLIEQDIGNYSYESTRFIPETIYFFAGHRTLYKDSQDLTYAVVLNEFYDEKFGEDYLSAWISPKINPDHAMQINGRWVFEYSLIPGNPMIIWRHGNYYVQVQSANGSIPHGIIKAYLELYPSDCTNDSCESTGISPEELYNRYFIESRSSGYYNKLLKHSGFYVQCTGRHIIVNKDQLQHLPNLTFVEFSGKVAEILENDTPSQEELEGLYATCISESGVSIGAIPMEGFLKDCYNVSSQIMPPNENFPLSEISFSLCVGIGDKISGTEYLQRFITDMGLEPIYEVIRIASKKELNKSIIICTRYTSGGQIYRFCEDDVADSYKTCFSCEEGRKISEEIPEDYPCADGYFESADIICGYSGGAGGGGSHNVPEMGPLSLLVAVAASTAGLLFIRKEK